MATTPPKSGAGAAAGGSDQRGADLLKRLLDEHLKTTALQSDYADLYRNLPNILEITAEIGRRKQEADKANEEALATVTRVLSEAREKAEALSDALTREHATLSALLKDGSLMDEAIRHTVENLGKSGKAGHSQAGGASGAGAGPHQLNSVLTNIQTMISREVERQVELLRGRTQDAIARAAAAQKK